MNVSRFYSPLDTVYEPVGNAGESQLCCLKIATCETKCW